MARLTGITLWLPIVLVLCGCRSIGEMFEGVNSDLDHGGTYARVPQQDAYGETYVPERDWAAGPGRIW